MRIAIIDADLIGRKKHRFPNLACMKLSGYYKAQGHEVVLKTEYEGLDEFDRIFLSKVFTDTEVPEDVLKLKNLEYGGTGFYYDKDADWVQEKLNAGAKRNEYRFYLDYSIGFLTRGCFRKCQFCVNKNYDRVYPHSPVEEFMDPERKKICLLDDNFFGSTDWEVMLQTLKDTGKPFQFRQGLDERLLDDRKCQALFSSRYDDTYTFAFDNLADTELVERKIILARKYTQAHLRFYCFCGFDRQNIWDEAFWVDDVFSLLKRIEILMKHRCLPYVMRFNRYTESPFRGVYISIARWANQPNMYKKQSLREFAEKNGRKSACYQYLEEFERRYPEAAYFYDLKYRDAIQADGASDTGEGC